MADESTTWVHIEDFTPGIRHTISPSHPLGSATELNTWGCHADRSKGLIPAPKAVREWKFNPTTQLGTAPTSLASESYRIGGIFCNDPVFTPGDTAVGPDQNNSEVYVAFEWWTTGGRYHRAIHRLLRHRNNPTWQEVYATDISQSYDALSRPKRCYFASGRSNSADADQVGPIVVGWVYGGMARIFPDDTDTDALGTAALPGESVALVFPDVLVGHQGRAMIFPLSLGLSGATDVLYASNENFYYSGVNNWITLDTQLNGLYFNQIAGYENPTGYGVIASNDAGELLLIKARGGAVLIRGDLTNPSHQTLPNVRGTGQSLDLGTHTPIGYMYPVDASQVWIWLGGDSTVNAAPFLRHDFFRPQPRDLDGEKTGWGHGFTQSTAWGNLVLMGNNWFADTDVPSPEGVPSWWKLDKPIAPTDEASLDSYTFHKYTVDWKGRHMYAAQMGIRGEDDPVLVEYDSVVLRSDYSWQSHPLPFTIDPSMVSQLDHVLVTAVGEGSVDVIVTTEQNPVGQKVTLSFDSNNAGVKGNLSGDPERHYATRRMANFGIQGTHHQVRLVSRAVDGEAVAPHICAPVSLGFKSAAHIPQGG